MLLQQMKANNPDQDGEHASDMLLWRIFEHPQSIYYPDLRTSKKRACLTDWKKDLRMLGNRIAMAGLSVPRRWKRYCISGPGTGDFSRTAKIRL